MVFRNFGVNLIRTEKNHAINIVINHIITPANMENKIQELTDKIYREGVEKGNEEAQKLIAKAQEEAKRIIEDAHK